MQRVSLGHGHGFVLAPVDDEQRRVQPVGGLLHVQPVPVRTQVVEDIPVQRQSFARTRVQDLHHVAVPECLCEPALVPEHGADAGPRDDGPDFRPVGSHQNRGRGSPTMPDESYRPWGGQLQVSQPTAAEAVENHLEIFHFSRECIVGEPFEVGEAHQVGPDPRTGEVEGDDRGTCAGRQPLRQVGEESPVLEALEPMTHDDHLLGGRLGNSNVPAHQAARRARQFEREFPGQCLRMCLRRHGRRL